MNVRHVPPVYGTGIRTRDLHNMSLLPLPLDQGSRISEFLLEWSSNKRSFAGKRHSHKWNNIRTKQNKVESYFSYLLFMLFSANIV